MMTRVFLLVDATAFYVSCEQMFQAELRERPVLVMTNNDGCIAALNVLAKSLGLKRGMPIFQCRDIIVQHQVITLSSNYPLYQSMSDRMAAVLSTFSPLPLERYSIDESFADISHIAAGELLEYGHTVKDTILRQTGLVVLVGIAATKTLTKLALTIGKARPEDGGVVNLVDWTEGEIDAFLAQIGVEEIWGIRSQRGQRLRERGIVTAKDFKEANPQWIHQALSIVGRRIQLELHGISCLPLEPKPKPKKSIATAKTFGQPIARLDELSEAVASYTAMVGVKLRRQHSQAAAITVFLSGTSPAGIRHAPSKTGQLTSPTAFTPDLIVAALSLLRSIYRPGLFYHKCGVWVSDILPQAVIQTDLFGETVREDLDKQNRLMQAIDWCNATWGHHTLFFGAQGITQTWKMRQARLSPRYTTKWGELLVVHAR